LRWTIGVLRRDHADADERRKSGAEDPASRTRAAVFEFQERI